MLVDAFTLADDLTFDAGNPDSIRGCLANARENARQVRNVVDEDLWACLNLAFFDLRDLGITDIWRDRPGDFYRRTEDAVRTFFGIAGSNMYRDDGWHFLQLGRFVERAQLISALLEAQLAVYPAGGPTADQAVDGSRCCVSARRGRPTAGSIRCTTTPPPWSISWLPTRCCRARSATPWGRSARRSTPFPPAAR